MSSSAHQATDAANYASQLFPLGVGASLFMGISVADWALLLSILIGLLNVLWFAIRFYDHFTKKPEGTHAGESNTGAETKASKKSGRP